LPGEEEPEAVQEHQQIDLSYCKKNFDFIGLYLTLPDFTLTLPSDEAAEVMDALHAFGRKSHECLDE
jgi:hypothetical protein